MNMQFKLMMILFLLWSRFAIGQTTLILSKQTLKIAPGKTETISLGFLKDDIVRITFEEEGEKELKQILVHFKLMEITEKPCENVLENQVPYLKERTKFIAHVKGMEKLIHKYPLIYSE